MIIAANNDSVLRNVKRMLTERFKMKDMGKLRHFLGIDFEQEVGVVKMSRERYVKKILDLFGMQDCKSRETPCEPKLEYAEDAEKMIEPRKYREQ